MTESKSHGYYFEELKEGMSASFSKTITDADITAFAEISGDRNPVHLDDEFAKSTIFKERIAHGALTCSFISTVLGMELPGPGAIFISQEHTFKRPVKIGDTVEARVTIIEMNPKKRFVHFRTECLVGGKVVVTGKACVMVDTKPTE